MRTILAVNGRKAVVSELGLNASCSYVDCAKAIIKARRIFVTSVPKSTSDACAFLAAYKLRAGVLKSLDQESFDRLVAPKLN